MGSRNVVGSCPSCLVSVDETFRFCPGCGASLDPSDTPTGTAPRRVPPEPTAAVPPVPSTPAAAAVDSRGAFTMRPPVPTAAGERFAPGTVLIDRYRISGLLGRGGMGEVYRAEDLKLGHPVALKFLPRSLEGDAERLERLYSEVRMARQVSHPAVCRVWDVGEAAGQHFLSMEFVDGENLASLLRRIGRLPGDKALEIARQVAAGLAAAHDRGVLHRDLKPANVMLDGQGQVRLTDFGLAGLAGSLGEDVRSGTPAYMSPEQLHGREVTRRSDIYALGLLLYELFTGRRAFEGRTIAELTRKHREETALDPSLIVPDISPAVERTILACLEKDPRRRPPSVAMVLAMLSGQDPLQAALAAGETPSPELVAAAGETQALRPLIAWACLGTVLLALVAVPWVQSKTRLFGRIPVEKSPAVLEDRAQELLARVGVESAAADSETGLSYDAEYFPWLRARETSVTRWDSLRTGEPPVVLFWYRQSPRPLAARATDGRVTWSEPPIEVTGMAGVRFDLRGRLTTFYAVPPQVESSLATPATAEGRPAQPDWGPFFAEARLDRAQLRPAVPQRTPPFYADVRAAWDGSWPARPEIPIRVEAAGHRGRPVYFQVVSPWTRAERTQPWQPSRGQRVARTTGMTVSVLLTVAGGVLARRNLRLGRGDRRGAARLAISVGVLALCSWAFRVHHVLDPMEELGLVAHGAGGAVLLAIVLWLFYLALEPYVRRLRPWTLVSWTRALNGGFGDAVVGRDTLVGMAAGAFFATLLTVFELVPARESFPAPSLDRSLLELALGSRRVAAYLLEAPVDATVVGVGLLLTFLVLRLLTRSSIAAALPIVAAMVVNQVGQTDGSPWLAAALALAVAVTFLLLLLYVGVLGAIAGVMTLSLLTMPSHSWALGSWTSAITAPTLVLLAVLAALAFRTALGSRSSVRQLLAAEPTSSRPS